MELLNKLEKIAYWWVKVSCYLALLMPFIFVPWTIYPYIFGKTVFFITVLMLALPWYIFLIIRRPEYRPKRTLILYGLGIYFLAMVLATIFSFDANRSFWSYPERMTGLWALFHYLLFFFMASGVFRGWDQWKKIIGFSVGVSIALTFVAFIQRVSPELVLQTGARTGSFMNNPIFFAAYLIFNIFFTLILLQKSKELWVKAVWGIALALQVLGLLFAETRGAIIGFALAVFVYLILFAILHKEKRVKTIAGILLIAIIISGVAFWFVKDQEWLKSVPGLNRFYGISFSGGTVETRLIAWDAAWKGFVEKPVFGWGPENYFYTFNKYYNPKSLEYSFYETWFDHAHNQILDQMNNTGVVGTAAYLALFALVIIYLIKMYRSGKMDLYIFSGSIAILIGYFVQNLFIFDQPNVLIMFYFSLAWWQAFTPHGSEGRTWIKSSGVAVATLVAFAIVAWTVLYLFTFRPAFASTWVRDGVINAQKGNIGGMAEAFERGLGIPNQYPDMIPLYYGRETVQLSRGQSTPIEGIEELFGRTAGLLDEVSRLHPANIYNYYLLALIYTEWGRIDSEYYNKALEYIDKSLEFSPERQQLGYVRGNILMQMGRGEEAVEYYKELVALDEDVTESWWNLGVAYTRLGDYENAIAAFERSMEIGRHPASLMEVAALIEVYSQIGDIDKIIEMYNIGIDRFDSENSRLYSGLARAYFEKGDYELARMYAKIAVELDPSIAGDTEQFLQMISLAEMGIEFDIDTATTTEE